MSMEKFDYIPKTDIKMIHVDKSYSFGTDSILLSDFAKMKKGKNLLDIGAGTGILSFRCLALYKLSKVYGVEIQEEKARLMEENKRINKLTQVEVINCDLKDLDFPKASLDYIITNPPYYKSGENIRNKSEEFLISRQEVKITLPDIFSFAEKTLKERGKLFMINRAERLVDMVRESGRLIPKRIQFVESRPGQRPCFVLMEFVKNAGDGLKFEDPIIIYQGNEYSKEIGEIYGL